MAAITEMWQIVSYNGKFIEGGSAELKRVCCNSMEVLLSVFTSNICWIKIQSS
jgi:hypothetical protein